MKNKFQGKGWSSLVSVIERISIFLIAIVFNSSNFATRELMFKFPSSNLSTTT